MKTLLNYLKKKQLDDDLRCSRKKNDFNENTYHQQHSQRDLKDELRLNYNIAPIRKKTKRKITHDVKTNTDYHAISPPQVQYFKEASIISENLSQSKHSIAEAKDINQSPLATPIQIVQTPVQNLVISEEIEELKKPPQQTKPKKKSRKRHDFLDEIMDSSLIQGLMNPQGISMIMSMLGKMKGDDNSSRGGGGGGLMSMLGGGGGGGLLSGLTGGGGGGKGGGIGDLLSSVDPAILASMAQSFLSSQNNSAGKPKSSGGGGIQDILGSMDPAMLANMAKSFTAGAKDSGNPIANDEGGLQSLMTNINPADIANIMKSVQGGEQTRSKVPAEFNNGDQLQKLLSQIDLNQLSGLLGNDDTTSQDTRRSNKSGRRSENSMGQFSATPKQYYTTESMLEASMKPASAQTDFGVNTNTRVVRTMETSNNNGQSQQQNNNPFMNPMNNQMTNQMNNQMNGQMNGFGGDPMQNSMFYPSNSLAPYQYFM